MFKKLIIFLLQLSLYAHYDAIIVGSGIGGLTAASLLSKKGYKVLILEQNEQVGGYCSSFERDGFKFNIGVEDVSGLWKNGATNYLLEQLKINKDDLFIRNTRRYVVGTKQLDLSDSLDGFIDQLCELYPHEEKNIRKFFRKSERMYEEIFADNYSTYGIPLASEVMRKKFGIYKLLAYVLKHPRVLRWIGRTYKRKIEKRFNDSELRQWFYVLLPYLGTVPETTKAISGLGCCLGYYLKGGYFPKGGSQRFADKLKDFIEEHGGTILVNTKVEEILVENGEVIGVRTKDNIYNSTIIVANVNAKHMYLNLIDPIYLNKNFLDKISHMKMSCSALIVYLGLDIVLPGYPTLIKDTNKEIDIVIADANMAPPGKSSVTLLEISYYSDWPEYGTEEYNHEKQRRADDLIDKAEGIIPNIRDHIIVKDIATPITFERYTSMPEGSLYSFDNSIGYKRLYFKSPIKGLYLANSSTQAGAGIEGAVIAGVTCTHEICGW